MASLQKITTIKYLPVLSLKANFVDFTSDIHFFELQPLDTTARILDRIGVVYRSIENQWQSSISHGDIERSLSILEQEDEEYFYFSLSYKSIESYYLADLALDNVEDTLFIGDVKFDKKAGQLQFESTLTPTDKADYLNQLASQGLPVQHAVLQAIFGMVRLSKQSLSECLSHLQKSNTPWIIDLKLNSRKLKCKYVIHDPRFEEYKISIPMGEKEFKQTLIEGKIEFLSSAESSASPLTFKGQQLQLNAKVDGKWKVIKQALPSPSTKNLNFDPKTKEPQWIMNI